MKCRQFAPPLPEWTSLRRSVHWMASGEPLLAVQDEMSLGELVSIGSEVAAERANLLLALRHGQISAKGELYVYDRRNRNYHFHPAVDRDSAEWRNLVEQAKAEVLGSLTGCKIFQDQVIPEPLWEKDNIAWDSCRIFSSSYSFHRLRGMFSGIVVKVSELVRTFCPQNAESETNANEVASAGTGRRRTYDWDAFFVEITVRADLDGLPEAQADLGEADGELVRRHLG